MKISVLNKSSSLDEGDCLTFHSIPSSAIRPSHYHGEFELLLLPEAGHLELSLGEETFHLHGAQLVLAGPEIPLGWGVTATSGQCLAAASSQAFAIRWPADLLGDRLLGKNQLKPMTDLLGEAGYGILFPPSIIPAIRERLLGLRQKKGFGIMLDLLSLLHELSLAGGKRLLSGETPALRVASGPESPIHSAVAFMKNNYFLPMTLGDVARKARMTKGAFCRSIRKNTGKTYAESLNEIRVGHICRMLLETSDNVSEIAYRAGYRNVYHFHRSFKRQKGCTPKEFRERHTAVQS